MSGKKDDTCGGGSELEHDLDPMRHLGGHGPAGYASGPTHTDRADFATDEGASADAAAEPTAEATAEDADDDEPAT
jgi:hypothetical protein